MTFRKIISHPFTVVSSFFLITFPGSQAGGTYLLYLVTGLTYGAIYSLLGAVGIGVILFSHFKFKRDDQSMEESLVNLLGAVLLIVSLFLFFYSYAELSEIGIVGQVATMMSLIVFGILITCFITMMR